MVTKRPGDKALPVTMAGNVLRSLKSTFKPDTDWSQPCAQPIPRPAKLRGTLVQGSRDSSSVTCNRPLHHDGPHRVYNQSFVVLAERAQ